MKTMNTQHATRNTPTPVALLIMTGNTEGSPAERMVAGARRAITRDIVERALASGAFAPIVVSTNDPTLIRALRRYPVEAELDPAGESFHFGARLRELVAKYALQKVFYVGGGSAPLLPAKEMARIADELRAADRLLIVNNFYSTDFAAFTPTSALEAIDLPGADNDLGWQLGEVAKLPICELPRTAATQLDVDTPSDLMTLSGHPALGPHTRTYLESLDLDTAHVRRATRFFVDRDAEVLVAGRVSAATWAYLEQETACRVRVFAEERGMRASGRQARGQARSVLGYLLDQVGVERFFAILGEMSQAVFLDSRVLFAHRGLWPTTADRFASDLRQPEAIADPFVRDLTTAAMNASIPVVMGGHSLVAGGLYALVETAWATSGVDLPPHLVRYP
ncbi:MAG: hypothetical protein DRI80_14065 [Chloroflexota bacterium]|nr:MAG: hypothetical protein DRI80_14065 [Chloroflexota bacterium]